MSYVIESTMRPTAQGGDWQGPWSVHTTLKCQSLREARAEFRKFVRGWDADVRQHFRLARHNVACVTVYTA